MMGAHPRYRAMNPLPPANPAASATPDSAALRESIDQRLLRQLYTHGWESLPSAAVAALTTAGFFYLISGSAGAFAWAAALLSGHAMVFLNHRRNLRRYPPARYPEGQPGGLLAYLLPMWWCTACWALVPWVLMPAGGAVQYSGILCMLLFGVMAASVPAVAPSRWATYTWLIAMTASLTLYFALQGGRWNWLLAFAALQFGAIMMRYAISQRASLIRNLETLLLKQALSDQVVAQAVELERLHAERARFFAAANHDLRQPVYALTLLTDTLRRNVRDPALQPVAEHAAHATRQVGLLLGDMLEISRLDAGAVPVRERLVSVEDLCVRLYEVHEPRANDKHLQLRFRDGNLAVRTDPDLLHRVLTNLVDNALKYTQSGGVLIAARRRGDRVRLAVWDTGRGIPPEHQRNVFNEFFQTDNPQRDRAQGLGLGLSIVQRTARLLGSEVQLRSRPGRGSVFWLDLPLATAEAAQADTATFAAAPDAAIDTPLGLPGSVLVLDDEAPVRLALASWLAPHCAAVHTAASLDEALAHVRAHGRADQQGQPGAIAVMLLDFRLAGPADGLQAAAALRQAAGWQIPAALVTGDTDPARVRQALGSQLAVLFKPVEPAQLRRTLRALTEPPHAEEAEEAEAAPAAPTPPLRASPTLGR